MVCLVGPAGSPATPPNPLKVRDSFSEQLPLWAWHRPYTHCGCMDKTHPVLGVGLACLRFAQFTVGQCGQWTVGRAARTQESASLRKRVLCTRRVKRPSWVYYVLGAAVKTDQKSRAAQRHCWDRVGIRGNI